MGICDFRMPACGEWYDNEDGTSRQEELAKCEPGDPLKLVREPDNPHDPLAVGVYTLNGVRVGFLRRHRAQWLGSKIDRGYDVRAIVERIKGSTMENATLGLVMRLNLDGDDPELGPIDPGVVDYLLGHQ